MRSELTKKFQHLSKKQWFFLVLLGLAFALWIFVLIVGDKQYADESAHNRQIRWFLKGNFGTLSDLTTIPGYHAAVALVSTIYDHPNLRKIRFASFFLSSISIWIFYLISKKLKHKDSLLKTGHTQSCWTRPI